MSHFRVSDIVATRRVVTSLTMTALGILEDLGGTMNAHLKDSYHLEDKVFLMDQGMIGNGT